MTGVRLALAAVAASVLLPASAHASTLCSMQGPAWTEHPAHGSKVYRGTTYRLVLTGVGCTTAKGHIRKLWKANPTWPYASRANPTPSLKSAPAGWRCQSTVESKINRKEYAGSCLGGDITAITRFDWAPKIPKI